MSQSKAGLVAAAVCIGLSTQALAYLDPGTGSLLLSSVVAIFASLFFVLRGAFYKIIGTGMPVSAKKGASSLATKSRGAFIDSLPLALLRESSRHEEAAAMQEAKESSAPSKTPDIVIYSEGKQYHSVFKPILEYFDSVKVPYLYLAGSKADYDLHLDLEANPSHRLNPGAQFSYIGEGISGFSRLNSLQCRLVLMTTPQLDVLQLRRSKGVKHYCHIIHSPPHVDIYEVFALDYFDSVLTNSPIHTEYIREVEKLRNLKPKQISITGCTYLDILDSKLDQFRRNGAAPSSLNPTPYFFEGEKAKDPNSYTILVSPSWGREALLSKYGMKLIAPLANSKHRIIIRPHPQSYTSEAALLEGLKRDSAPYANIIWDSNVDNIYAMAAADLMVGDFSGVIFDFICLFAKPVITMEFDFNVAGYDLEDTGRSPWVKTALQQIGRSVKPSELERLPQIIENLLGDGADSMQLKEGVESMRESLWHHKGRGGEESGKALLRIYKEILLESLENKRQVQEELLWVDRLLAS